MRGDVVRDLEWFGYVWSGGRWGVQVPDDDARTCVIVDELGVEHTNGIGWADTWTCVPFDEVPERVIAREPLAKTFADAARAMGISFWCPECGEATAHVGEPCALCRLGALVARRA